MTPSSRCCDLRPYAADGVDWWVASDLGEAGHRARRSGRTTCSASAARRPRWRVDAPADVDRALDLGTGCGVQALHLEATPTEVVATDLSQRALAFARFNAALDEADWDVRPGSMLDPVAGSASGWS